MQATETAVRSDPDERMPQRGAYGVGLDTCCMVEVDPERFEVMVSEPLDGYTQSRMPWPVRRQPRLTMAMAAGPKVRR